MNPVAPVRRTRMAGDSIVPGTPPARACGADSRSRTLLLNYFEARLQQIGSLPTDGTQGMKPKIYFADITHTAQGISAATFPLGVSYVLAHAKSLFKSEFDFSLYKYPDHLCAAIQAASPRMLCFSSYSWNRELSYKIASLAKRHDPKIIVVF